MACEQVPKSGIGRRQKSSSERGGDKGRESVDVLLMPPFRPLVINPWVQAHAESKDQGSSCAIAVTAKTKEFVWEYLRSLLDGKNSKNFSIKMTYLVSTVYCLLFRCLLLLIWGHFSQLSFPRFPTPKRKTFFIASQSMQMSPRDIQTIQCNVSIFFAKLSTIAYLTNQSVIIQRMSTGSLSRPADFSFRSTPHLGACSQATEDGNRSVWFGHLIITR